MSGYERDGCGPYAEREIEPLNDSQGSAKLTPNSRAMGDDLIDYRALIYRLANALWHHRDAWDEWGSEDYNRRHRAEIEQALNEARQIGWLPDDE